MIMINHEGQKIKEKIMSVTKVNEEGNKRERNKNEKEGDQK
jgi:hypothetical protein